MAYKYIRVILLFAPGKTRVQTKNEVLKMKIWFYLFSCLLLVFAPGPDNCFVLAQSAAFGAAAGFAVTAGLISGLCVHIALAVAGAAALLKRFPRVADLIHLLGACYLLWVAWGMWGGAFEQISAEHHTLQGFYVKGVILNLSNPKVILFFLAFLPRFLPEPCANRSLYLCFLGMLFAVCAFIGMATIALLGGVLSRVLCETPHAASLVSRGAALAVAAIAGWIFLSLLRERFGRKQKTAA